LKAPQPGVSLRNGLLKARLFAALDLLPQPGLDPDLRRDAFERSLGRSRLHTPEVDPRHADFPGISIPASMDSPASNDRAPNARADPDGDHRLRASAGANAWPPQRREPHVVLEAEARRRKRPAKGLEDLPARRRQIARSEEDAVLRVHGSRRPGRA